MLNMIVNRFYDYMISVHGWDFVIEGKDNYTIADASRDLNDYDLRDGIISLLKDDIDCLDECPEKAEAQFLLKQILKLDR